MKWCALTVLCLAGCVPTHSQVDTVVDMTDVPLVDDRFESAPLPTRDAAGNFVAAASPWTPFAAREQLTFLFRPLAHTPTTPSVWVAFASSGLGAGPAAGDEAHIDALDVLDPGSRDGGGPAGSLTITNATEQDFFVRVVVE